MLITTLILAALLAWSGARIRLKAPARAPLSISLWLSVMSGVLVGLAPLSRIAVKYLSAGAPLAGDARSHAIIANAIATRGAPHGFVDVYQGGFPIALHYPAVAWLADAALIGFGMGAAQATSILGLVCCTATPLLGAYFVARVSRSHAAAVASGLFLAAVSASPPIAGGFGTFLDNGVLSQVVATPIAVLFLGALFVPSRALPPALLGPLLMSAHPQIAASALLVSWVATAAIGDRRIFARTLQGTWCALGWGVLVYGPGIATLKYPFGWPDLMPWHIVGFGTTRFEDWFFDGRLFDDARDPWLTTILAGALLMLVARAKQPVARALLASAVAVLFLTAAGPSIARAGKLGNLLLTFAQPMRVLAMFPLVAAAMVGFGAHAATLGLAAALSRVTIRPRAGWMAASVLVVTLLGIGVDTWPALKRLARERDDASACPWDRAEADEIKTWLRALDRGRLHFDEKSVLCDCAYAWNFDASSSIPIATSSSAGGHVGDHFRAFHSIKITEPGADRRAETLGVRFVLAPNDRPPRGAFVARRTSKHATLWERIGGTDLVGRACIRDGFPGDERALREHVKDHMTALLDEPDALLATTPQARHDCTLDVSIAEHPREPGAFAATIDAHAPTAVVVRATTHPFWTVRVDGAVKPHINVFPGFMAVELGAGRHELTADFRFPWWLLLALGAFAALLLRVAYSTSRST